VESSCKLGNEPSGSIKCWERPSGCTSFGLSSATKLHRVSYLVISPKLTPSKTNSVSQLNCFHSLENLTRRIPAANIESK
jgi:hypothetical protein